MTTITTKKTVHPSYFLFVDLETTGFIKAPKGGIDLNKDEQFPHIVQISWELHACDASTKTFTTLSSEDFIIRPTADYTIPAESSKIHGISQEHALAHGVPLKTALLAFIRDMFLADRLQGEEDMKNPPQITIVCHNVEFDVPILMHNLFKAKDDTVKYHFQGEFLHYLGPGKKIQCICTMLDTIDLCKLPYANGGRGYKYPKLNELFYTLFQEAPKGQLHNSKFDVECTVACFKELYARGNLLTIRNMNLGCIENGFCIKLLK
jgi:DNA polymerase-3 subunit epsilon